MNSVKEEIDFSELIQDDRIHGSLYTDADIYNEELTRIFYNGWVFVGHDSEIPESGDWVRRNIGEQPVLMIRDKAGQVQVLMNRCTHRGNLLFTNKAGNDHHLLCPYHGWVFDADGTLLDTPEAGGYGKQFNKPDFNIPKVNHVDSYRGFVFACAAEEAIALAEHLGDAAQLLDRVADMSPSGEIELSGGWLQHRFKANWKMLPENDTDGYHVASTHQSFVMATSSQAPDYVGEGSLPQVRDWGNGHTEIDFTPGYRNVDKTFEWYGRLSESKVPDYIAAMEQRYGKAEARKKLVDGPPHAIIFPNLFLAEMNIVYYYPVAPDECVQVYTPLYLKGAPELNKRTIRQTEGAVGPAAFLLADDVTIAERTQIGLRAHGSDWLDLSRGVDREEVDEDGHPVSHLSDETSNRAFWNHYKAVMNQ